MSSAEVTSPEVLTKDEVVINLEDEEANLRPKKSFPLCFKPRVVKRERH